MKHYDQTALFHKKILIADDETDLLEMLCSVFSRAGYTDILTASYGIEYLLLFIKADTAIRT